MVRRKKVVITGAAGHVGTALRKRLRDRYNFRLVFHSHVPDDVDDGDEVVVSDVTDFEAMLEAGSGVDAIVHLAIAGHSTRIRNPVHRSRLVLDVDVPGVYNVLESAKINGVPTVVFASTNHVSGMYEKEGLLSVPDAPVRPDGIYAAGKAFGEALARFYSDQHGLRVLCLRIANFNNKEEPERYYEPGYSRWLSPRDLAQLTWRCIEQQEVRFGIFFGVSAGSEKKWDLSNARKLLGYDPEDDGSLPEYRSMYKKERRRA